MQKPQSSHQNADLEGCPRGVSAAQGGKHWASSLWCSAPHSTWAAELPLFIKLGYDFQLLKFKIILICFKTSFAVAFCSCL